MTNGLSECLCLPESEKYDTPLCSLAADVDFDGLHELIVGTYGQVVTNPSGGCADSFSEIIVCDHVVTHKLAVSD